MFAIKFRYTINHSDEVKESIIDFFTGHNYDKLLLAQESGDNGTNQHYQAYVLLPFKTDEDKKKGMKRIRASFTAKFKTNGNKCYSVSACEELLPIEYCAYLLKENPIFVWGFTEEEYKQVEEHQIKVKEEIEEKKKKKSLSTYKKVEEDFLTRYKEVEDGGSPLFDTRGLRQGRGEEEPISSSIVLLFVLDYWRKNELMIREQTIQNIVMTLLFRYMPSYQGTLQTRLLERIEKRN